jgi:hypothetical protein
VCLALVVAVLAVEAAAQEGRGVLAFQGLEGETLRVRLDADANQLRHTLHLGEAANGRVERARLVVTGLADEAGEQVSELKVVGGEELALPVEPARSVEVLLEADIPAPGTYHATLTLLQAGHPPTSVQLLVSRPRPVLNVALEVAPARGQLPLFRGEGTASLQLTLQEKEGRPVMLSPPVLARLLLQAGPSDDSGVQALAEARFQDARGQPLEAPFLLNRRVTLPLRLQLSGLPGPGRYEGTLRVGAMDAPAVDTPFVLHLREHPLVAALLIALGVGLSFLVRKYVMHERPRMVRQQRVLGLARVLEELKAAPALSPRDRELLTAVARGVDGALADSSGPERLELLERQVACTRDWLRMRRAVEEMRPASLRAEPQAKLAEVERTLRAPGATAEDLGRAEATLAALPSELEVRMREHLTERLALVREELDTLARESGTELARQLEPRVRPHLDRAAALLERDSHAAFAELDAARLAQTLLLAERLAASLEAPAPSFLGHDAWVALRTELRLALAPLREAPPPPVDTAVGAYERALSLSLKTLAEALADTARARLRAVGEQAGQQERWLRVLDGAEGVSRHLAERKLPEAARALETARLAYEVASAAGGSAELGPVSFSGSDEEGPAPGQPGEPLPAFLFEGVQLFVPTLEGRPPSVGLALLERRMASMDLVILALVLGLSTLAGLRLLWLEDPAWGSLNDRLLAFSWGFGLHQVSHSGFSSLLGRMAKPESPPASASEAR